MRKLYLIATFLCFGTILNAQSSANYAFTTGTNGSLALDMNSNTVDMSTGTTQLIAASNDETGSAVTNLPFDFWLMGSRYTQFSVSSNGLLQLGAIAASGFGYNVSAGTATSPIISAFAAEGGTGATTGKVHFKVVGTAPNRVMVVEYIMNLYYTGGLPVDGTYQVRLYENGAIEFVYGDMSISSTTGTFDGTTGIGFAAGAAANSFVYITTSTNTATTTGTFTDNPIYPLGPIANLNSAANGSRRYYRLVPPVATAPTSLTFTGVTTNSMTLNWVDNATNEVGYVIYRSTDGINYNVVSQTAANAQNSSQSGLAGNTLYYWRVAAYTEGGPSAALAGNQSTLPCSPVAPGTYTVGPTGTYPTLTAALGGGTTGNVTFELQSTYTSAGETFPITVSASSCPFTGNVTVRPAAGATGLTITSSNTVATIDINSMKNLTIDGRPGGVGTTSQLSVINTSTTGVAVRFINDAQNNTLTYLDLQGQNTTTPATATVTSAGVVYFSTAMVATGYTSLGNDNNSVTNCDIHGTAGGTPAVGIFAIGTTTSNASYNDSINVSNNRIYDFFSAGTASSGLKVDAGNSAWTISGNSFYQTASRTTTASNTHRAIWLTPNTASIAPAASGFIVTGNFIGGTAASAGGTPLTMTGAFANVFQAMDLSVGVGAATSVQNNTIRNLAISTTSGAGFIGISQVNGNVNIGTVTGNTIGSQSATGDITVTTTTTGGGTVIGYRASGGTGTTVNIANNTIGGITTVGSATLGVSFQGIAVTAGATVNVTNNTIGSTTTANSINASSSTTGNTQSVAGIVVTFPTTSTVSGNTIANLNNNYIGTGTGQVRGIAVSGSISSITGNTIRNLSNTSAATGTGTSASIVGLSMSSTSAGVVVTGNTIHSLIQAGASTTAAIQVIGLYFSGSTSTAGIVSKNFIHSFDVTAANPAAVMTGIDNAGGTTNFTNNIIRLGIKPDGTDLTNAQVVRGISSNSTSANNTFHHNTVYVGGTGVGTNTNNSFAFIRTSTSGTYNIRNNIFSNVRSNASTGGKHYAVYFTTNMTGVTIDYNVYQYTGTGGTFAFNGTADVAAYASGWTASDAHSYVGNPLFANATGTAAAVDMHLTAGSIAEGTGVAIATVTDDIDGQTRSGLTPTDIGADAGNYGATGIDVGAVGLVDPVAGACSNATQTISVSLRNFSANTINFATTNVTVTVTGAGPGGPYNSNFVVNTGTLASGASLVVTMPTTYNMSAAGTYTFNATAAATGDVNVANDAMGTETRVINAGATLSGTYTVGAGGNYTTLTAAVAAYNTASCLSGNVVFELTDALYSAGETFPITIKGLPSYLGSNTLTIRPASGNNATISGTHGTALIILDSARNVTIDGSNNASTSRNLTIANASTSGAAIRFIGNANNDVVKNSILKGVSTGTSGVVGFGTATGLGVRNNRIDNCLITGDATPTTYGVYMLGTFGINSDNNVITNCTIDKFSFAGIYLDNYYTNSVFSGNTIAETVTQTSFTIYGIYVNYAVIRGTIFNNKIYDLNTSATSPSIYGIYFANSNSADILNVYNNMISLGTTLSMPTATIYGMNNFSNTGVFMNTYHNTIYIGGSNVTGGNSYGIYKSWTNTWDSRNNIIFNARSNSSGTAKHYAVYATSTGNLAGLTSNYNDLFVNGTGGYVGFDGAADRVTLAAWQSATGRDANSVSAIPSFFGPTDLHLIPGLNILINDKGTPIASVPTDIDGDTRSTTAPDPGVDEITPPLGVDVVASTLVEPVVKSCYSNAETVKVSIRNFSGSVLNFAVSPVTVTVNVTGAATQTFTFLVNTGTLNPGDSLIVTLPGTLNMTATGNYTFNASATTPGDVNTGNDAMVPIVRTQAVVTAGTVSASQANLCLTGTSTLTLTGGAGGPIQWQTATSATGPWTNVGTNSNTFTPGAPITVTTYFRAYRVCNANSDTSNVQSVTVNNPQLVSTTPATRCGPGTVALGATGSGASTFNWYAAATGGVPIGAGATFTTPIINNTTTYYVSATSGGSSSTVGVSPTATTCGTIAASGATDWPIRFDVTAPVTINSAWVIPQSAGTLTVALRLSLSTTNIQTASFTFTAAQVGVPQQINLGWVISTPGNYQMTNTVGGIYRIGTFTCAYPFTSAGGGFSIVGSATFSNSATSTFQYNSFYDINVSEGCESPRQAVTATVTPAPAFNITDSLAVCNNAITPLQVTSPLANFNTYVWTPVAGLFTNATATTAYAAGTNASTVYERIATPGTYTFIAQANNTTTGCQNFDSVKVTVLPAAITVVPSPDQICVSGISNLSILPNPITFGNAQYQWQSSPNNTTYTNITGATNSTYTTPTITATTYYKVDLKNSAGVSCTTAYDTVIVNSPAILSSTPAALCGPGTMTLTATATPGATINWYTTPVGGSPVASGSPFTTPNLTATTTYYVAATTGSGGADVGIKTNEFPICGTPVSSGVTDYPIRFTTTKTIVINSAWVIPTSTNLTIALRAQGSTTDIATMSYTFTAGQVGQPQLINIGFLVTPPGNYQLTNTVGGMYRITTLGCGYPFTTATGGFSITGSATSSTGAASTTYYNGFFQLNVSEGCESPRIPVVAQVSANTAITQQPIPNISTCVGATMSLTVGASGANLVYQWRKNGVNIPNSNNDTLTINPVALTDAGTYDVVITGLCGTAQTSQVITVNVSAANTWTGAVSTDWNNPANWCGGVPTPTTDVAIFSGTPYQPVINASLANARNITINPGASLTLQPNGTLNLFGDFINNGSFIGPDGFVFFKGTANQNIAGMNVGNIMVNGTSGITLTGGMTVGTSAVLINGNVTLGVNNLTVTGDVTGTVTSHVITNSTGSFISKNVGNTAVTVPVGPSATSYNPITITNGSGRDYAVRVSTGLSPTISNPGKAVNRTWSITPSGTGTPTNVNITFQYEDTHMNTPGVPTDAMEIGVHNGSTWSVAVVSTTPSGTPTQRRVGGNFSQFGPMVVTNIGGISWITSAPPPVDPTVSSVKLLPNLVETSAVLRVVSTRTANIRWNVIDGQGRTVMSFDRSVLQGQNDIQLQLQHLASGMYYLSGTTDKGTTVVVKFVKQ